MGYVYIFNVPTAQDVKNLVFTDPDSDKVFVVTEEYLTRSDKSVGFGVDILFPYETFRNLHFGFGKTLAAVLTTDEYSKWVNDPTYEPEFLNPETGLPFEKDSDGKTENI